MPNFITPRVTPINVVTATWTQLAAHNSQRRFLGVYNETASNIYIAFGPEPTNITTAIRVKPDVPWQNNVLECARDKVWVYQASGSTITSTSATTDGDEAIKVCEG